MDISVIFVNWNSADFLRDCLASLYANTTQAKFEAVVVDNASYDGAEEMLRRDFPQVKYIQSKENLGFARANNLGVESSSGRILLFLNPDTLLPGNAIAEMAKCLEGLPQGGAIGCRILNPDRTVQTPAIQAFPTILNQLLDADAFRRMFPKSRLWGTAALFSDSTLPTTVEMVSGACLMLRRDVFQRVGGFSSDYFMYGEDVDLCRKVWKAGWRIYYLPTASIIHYGGQSTKRKPESSFSTLVMQESMDIYMRKFHGRAYAFLYRLTRILSSVIRLGLLVLLRVVPASETTRSYRSAALSKWMTNLRWALGLQKHRAGV